MKWSKNTEDEEIGMKTYMLETSYVPSLTTIPCISFHVIPRSLWWWGTSLKNSAHPGLVTLPASFWRREKMDG